MSMNNIADGMEATERYVEDKVMQVCYYKPLDIYSFLRSKKDLDEFFTFLMEEYIKDCKYIDEHGNKIFYPIIYIEKIFYYGIDYQYFIFVLAKFVSKKMDNSRAIFKRVLNDYAILQFNINSPICKINRQMLISFFESSCFVFNNRNYARPCKYFEISTPRLVEYEDKIVLHNTITFNKLGLERYINFEEIVKNNEQYFIKKEREPLVWGKIKVRNYLKENSILKYNYFTLNMKREEAGKLTFEESYQTFCK